MPKPLQSQWDFGELFPPEAIRRTLTVSELTGSIRRVLEKEVGRVSVQGEMTNLRVQSSGHVYFSLKDANAQIACVLFRNEARSAPREYLQDGQKVVIEGEITVYEARGQYQIRVLSVQLQGLGALQAAFERLKLKLQQEGLFDPARKRALPRFPARIGLVTSPDGAAIRDVLHTIERRDPGLQILLAPCRVQGAGAAREIATAIQMLNEWHGAGAAQGKAPLDLILLTRGGGSLEDLWAFNEEVVARAICHSALPVLSAVGHEIDFTISDFVADVRAATPTAAAEIITEGVFAAAGFVSASAGRLRQLAANALEEKSSQLRDTLRHLARLHPQRRIEQAQQRLDDFRQALARHGRSQVRCWQTTARELEARLARVKPAAWVARRHEALAQARGRLAAAWKHRWQARRDRVQALEARLRLLSPASVLERGYSISSHAETGAVIRDPGQLRPGERMRTRLHRGEILSTRLPPEE